MTLNTEPSKLLAAPLPMGTSWLLAACMEARGKQDLWIRQKPELLQSLREQAIIQSAESSNRIEGITIAPARLKPVVLGKAHPRDRSEEEVAGYRRALAWIYARKGRVKMTPAVIRKLHAYAQAGAGDAGEWKKRNNEIIEISPSGDRRIRFVPPTAKETPRLIEKLCKQYERASQEERIPSLLLAAAFVFDFLCIHPFRDGNGRVSRLLTALLLQQDRFIISRYISLERLTEESKEEYYKVLETSSRGWQQGQNDIVPWWNLFLGLIRSAYKELELRISAASTGAAKSDLLRQAILEQAGDFTLASLAAELPSVSSQLIKKILAELKGAGRIQLTGRGRSAKWTVV